MITFVVPAFLALLAAVPLLVWLHRREPHPIAMTVPSLIFLADEKNQMERPARRRFDADLLLALLAAAGLSLAAAQPVLAGQRDGRRVTCVRDVGPSMGARSADGTTASDRAATAVAAIRDHMASSDEVTVVEGSGEAIARRLRDVTSGLRVLISDRRPVDLPRGVLFVGVGDPAAVNAGIVSVDATVDGNIRRVFASIWNDATKRRVHVGPVGAAVPFDLPAFGATRATFDVPIAAGSESDALVRIHVVDPGDALAADDEVTLDFTPIHVAFDTGPDAASPAVVAATRRALRAVFAGGFTESREGSSGLFIGAALRAPAGWAVLEIGRVPAGREPARPAPKDPVLPSDSTAARDLDLASCEWLYAPGVAAHAPWARITRSSTGASEAPVTRWHGDPGLGRPAAIDGPIWPMFIENVARRPDERSVGAASRVVGVLDPSVSRLGRDVAPLDFATLDASPRDVTARRRALGPALAIAGSICLALLWFRPRGPAASPVR